MALIRRRASAPQREPRAEDFEIVELDGWVRVGDDEPLPTEGDVLVSAERWRRERDVLAARRFGVSVPNDATDEMLAELAASGAALLAVDFPSHRDGRGYSVARLLRARFGFPGELRAAGRVVRDQLAYLARVGFDAFEVAGRTEKDVLASFETLTVHYQASGDLSVPLWKRATRAPREAGPRSESDPTTHRP